MEPIEANVAATVSALRRGRYTVRTLAERIRDLGRSMDPSGVTKIEQGARRLGPSDLVALALALGVTPNRLLLPGTADAQRTVQLAAGVEVTEEQAWQWARGEVPLDGYHDGRRLSEFRAQNRPDQPAELFDVDAFRHSDEIKEIAAAVKEVAQRPGMSTDKVLELIRLSELFDTRVGGTADGEH